MATEAVARRTAPARIDTGISDKDRRSISDQLVKVLADTYTLLIKTHVYHWNVVGLVFLPLHELTEEHYQNLFEATDIIAERIRALGHPAPLGFEEMLPRSVVREETSVRTAEGMISHLVADHESLAKRMREVARTADEVGDLVTTDMLTERLAFHEKAIWMLGAMLAR